VSAPRPEVARYLARVSPRASAVRIEGDASTRIFYRVTREDGSTCVIMDYGSAFAGETDDVVLARIFEAAGLRVARILDVAGDPGCLLLEDLGPVTLEQALLEHGAPTRDLVDRAVRLAADVAVKGTPVLARSPRSAGPALDAGRFRFEMDHFLKHYVCGLLGRDPPPPALAPALHELADRAAETPAPVLCHRDFHSRNLMLLGGGDLAMVDIQDARWGPPGYDLASLLYDAYVDLDPDWNDAMIRLHCARTGADEADFRARFGTVAVQRMLKALGTFGFQARVRGNRRYLGGVPRTIDRLRGLLPGLPGAPGLAGLLERAGILDGPPSNREAAP
jgi:aminoglycoside/choline kinase family phosphotransferase